nr:FHA domain-containing protein [Vibrio sinus]
MPESGGNFGRAPSCDIALPDQSKRISRVHGQIKLTDNGYTVQHTSPNRSMLNDKPLLRDKEYPLNDGDILKVENYTILISTLVNSKAKPKPQEVPDEPFAQNFTLELQEDETDFLDTNGFDTQAQTKSSFSQDHVLSDDPFESDPFEDIEKSKIEPNIEAEPFEDMHSMDSSGPFTAPESDSEYLPVNTVAARGTYLRESIDKLITMAEKNEQYLQNPQLQHEALFIALEQTVDEFLEHFEPRNLEKQFNEYIGGIFSNKDKKYWRIYRKHFKHRQESGDFQRQFKALFMENMQKQSKESK